MLKRFDAVHLALVATLIYDVHANRRKKARFNALLEENEILWRAVTTSRKQIEFMDNLMTQHDVQVTEFDRIIFNNLD